MIQAIRNVCRYFGPVLLSILLAGCASLELEGGTWADADKPAGQIPADKTSPVDSIDIPAEELQHLSADALVQLAESEPHPQREALLLHAANRYLQQQELSKADRLLAQTNQHKLPQRLQLRQQALYAQLAVNRNRLDQAETIMSRLQSFKSKDPLFNDWYLLAQARLLEERGDIAGLIHVTNLRLPLLHDAQRQLQLQNTWKRLSQQNLAQLHDIRQQVRHTAEMGWIELAIIEKNQFTTPPAVWQQSLVLWQNAYPDHPAGDIHRQLSEGVDSLSAFHGAHRREKLALLLPLSSQYQQIAEMIRDGFLAAANANDHPVSVYDTGSTPEQIIPRYQQAMAQGARVIVGPLGKAAVNHLVQHGEISTPTILLGSIDSNGGAAPAPLAFMYSLDPEHEALAIANLAYTRGYHRAGVLYPKSSRGQRLHTAFVNRWRELGGSIGASVAYESDLYEGLGPVERLFSSTSPDVIFLASNAQQGRLLSQVIGKRRPELAVFATSSIFSGQSDPTRDFVLNNVLFTDMPWMIQGFADVQFTKQQLLANQQKSISSLDRFFAFGVDAYSLAAGLPRYLQQAGASINGVTGTIRLQGNRFQLNRPLIQFVDGSPSPVN